MNSATVIAGDVSAADIGQNQAKLTSNEATQRLEADISTLSTECFEMNSAERNSSKPLCNYLLRLIAYFARIPAFYAKKTLMKKRDFGKDSTRNL
jgi:hypothetical protein